MALIFPGEQSSAQGSVRQYSYATLPAKREDFLLNTSFKQVEGWLQNVNGTNTQAALNLGNIKIAEPNETDFALFAELAEGLHGVLKGVAVIGPVHLIDIDPVGPQAAQAILEFLDDPCAAGISPDFGFF